MPRIADFVEADRERAAAIVRAHLERQLVDQLKRHDRKKEKSLVLRDDFDDGDEDLPMTRDRPPHLVPMRKPLSRLAKPMKSKSTKAESTKAELPELLERIRVAESTAAVKESPGVRTARKSLQDFLDDVPNATYPFNNYSRERARGVGGPVVLDTVRVSPQPNSQRSALLGDRKYVAACSHDFVILKSDFDDPSDLRRYFTYGSGTRTDSVTLVLYDANVEGVTFAADKGAHPDVRVVTEGSATEHVALIESDAGYVYVTTSGTPVLHPSILPPVTDEDLFRAWGVRYGKLLRDRVKSDEVKIDRLHHELLALTSNLGAMRVAVSLVTDGGAAALKAQLEKIRAMSAVADVVLQEDGVVVVTTPLVSDEVAGMQARYMGVFEIKIGLLSSNLSYRNVAPPKDKKSHPHGNCMQGFIPYMTSAYSRFNYEAVVATVLEFLRGVTPEDAAGKRNYRENWPAKLTPPATPKAPSSWVILHGEGSDDEEEDD